MATHARAEQAWTHTGMQSMHEHTRTCRASTEAHAHAEQARTHTHMQSMRAPGPAFPAAASHPQDQHQDAPALQVDYFPPNGSYSLHYFPYYGKKAQVCGPQGPTAATAREGTARDFCL